jgi:archaellum component FlaG (FlaF/FlaG flagellin family)
VGLEAYINYDGWRSGIYGSDSFTSGQMDWLAADLAAASGSSARVLFYHYDFSNQINLSSLNADMALSGHIHTNRDDFSHPFDIITNNVCDGERSYRLIRVSGGVLQPSSTVSAGSRGTNLTVEYTPANDGTNYNVTATIANNLFERFEHSMLRFKMPNDPGNVDVSGGELLRTDHSGPYAVYYVGVDILPFSSQTVTVALDTDDTQAPTVVVVSPNGHEVWDIGSYHSVTWTASDDLGVKSVSVVLSTDGGLTYGDTLATGEADDGGYAWVVASDATRAARIKVIAYDWAGNSGADASDGDFEIRDPAADVPSHIVITRTSPNPFRDHVTIRFGLPRDGLVRLDLFDGSGRLVRNLASKEYAAGYHMLGWSNDGSVGPGVYFLRLRLGSDTTTFKAVVLR